MDISIDTDFFGELKHHKDESFERYMTDELTKDLDSKIVNMNHTLTLKELLALKKQTLEGDANIVKKYLAEYMYLVANLYIPFSNVYHNNWSNIRHPFIDCHQFVVSIIESLPVRGYFFNRKVGKNVESSSRDHTILSAIKEFDEIMRCHGKAMRKDNRFRSVPFRHKTVSQLTNTRRLFPNTKIHNLFTQIRTITQRLSYHLVVLSYLIPEEEMTEKYVAWRTCYNNTMDYLFAIWQTFTLQDIVLNHISHNELYNAYIKLPVGARLFLSIDMGRIDNYMMKVGTTDKILNSPFHLEKWESDEADINPIRLVYTNFGDNVFTLFD